MKKVRILPDQYIFYQGDEGDSAYLIISGSLVVEKDNQNVGKLSDGEIFGELSLILGENRQASIKAVTPSEIVEIKPGALKEILLSSSLELHKVIKQFSTELGKESGFTQPVSLEDLKSLVASEPPVISALALQLHHRLAQMIFL